MSVVRALVLALALAGGAPPARAAAPAPRASAALVARLRASGRAEARVEGGGDERPVRGRLALELPALSRLDLDAGGERMTCRPDGGEWLQPALGQLLRLGPDRVAPLLDVWALLLGTGRTPLEERALGVRRFLLVPRGGAVDSAWVTLGADGLPTRLATRTGDAHAEWRLRGWRFAPARGRSAFVLAAPPGVTVVPLD